MLLSWIRRGRAGFVLAFAAFVVSCSDDGGVNEPSPGNNNGPGTPVTAEERFTAINLAESMVEAFAAGGLRGTELNAAIATVLAAMPQFEQAGVDTTTLTAWARFTDGRLLIINNNRMPEPVNESLRAEVARIAAQGRAAGVDAARAGHTRAAFAEATELPASDRARLLHSFGPDFDQVQAPIADMAKWLKTYGYEVVEGQEGDARVETLRRVKGDGFFYFNTHGGSGIAAGGQKMYAIQSSSLVTPDTDKLPDYQDDLDNGRLVYMTGANGSLTPRGEPIYDTRYAITYRFVEKYMSFEKNSIVFLNVCFSAADHDDIHSFIFAMHQKGAGVYLGWTKVVSSDGGFQSVRYFVDRLLGANEYRPENPKQRPFAWPAVLEDMTAKGLTVDGQAQLVAKPRSVTGTGVGILRPSIGFVYVDVNSYELGITGLFGERPPEGGRVTINDGSGEVALAIKEWSPDFIITDLPRTGPGSTGDVVVHVGKRASNPRRLNRWQGTLRYTWQDVGSLRLMAEMDVDVRMDAAPLRQKPGQKPFRVEGLGTALELNAGLHHSGDGQYIDSETPGCTYTTTYSGNGSIPAGSTGPSAFHMIVRGDSETPRLRIFPAISVPYNERFVAACDGSSTTYDELHYFTIERQLLSFDGFLDVPTDAAMRARPDRRQVTRQGDFGANATATIEWTEIVPTPAYDATQAR